MEDEICSDVVEDEICSDVVEDEICSDVVEDEICSDVVVLDLVEDEILSDVVEDEIRLDVSADQKRNWIVEVEEKFKKMKSILKKEQPQKRKQPLKIENTIYRVPANICEIFYHSDYEPYKVSFGPYYHGYESCRSTQDIKERVLFHSFERSNKTIQDYVKALDIQVLHDLRKAYHELDPNWQQDDDAFLQLMIYDGCFLLEILREAPTLNNSSYDNISDSPVWGIDGISRNKLMEDYRHDMLLLGNQLPMLALEKLLAVQTDKSKSSIFEKIQKIDPQEYINRDILKFVFPRVNIQIPTKKCLHVLDLNRHGLLSQGVLRGTESKVTCLWRIMNSCELDIDMDKCQPGICMILLFLLFLPVLWVILAVVDMILFLLKLLIYIFKTQPATEFHDFINIPSASDLDKVGIGFTSKTKSLRDISFGRRTLGLPQISVDGATKSMFLNMIAFEQLHKDAKSEVSSYVYFISRLIQGADDVRILQRHGVIHSRLLADEIVELFNSLTKDIMHDPDSFMVSRYRHVSGRLTDSFNKMNKPWQKDLWQTYLRSPWAIVSLFAAFLLFSLTSLQTAYTVLSYYNPK